MNKTILRLAFGFSVMVLPGVTVGDEKAKPSTSDSPIRNDVEVTSALGDLRITMGTKLWINSWEKFTIDPQRVTLQTTQSGTEVTPIPTIAVKYQDFFISGSYFAKTSYTFRFFGNAATTSLTPFPASPFPASFQADLRATRSEWDLVAGYFFHPNIAFLAGYKQINQRFDTLATELDTQLAGDRTSLAGEATYSGPMIGLVGSVPIGSGFGVYGNFAYGFLDADFGYSQFVNGTAVFDKYNKSANYILVDGGVSYTYKPEPKDVYPLYSIGAFAGYRYQAIEVSNLARGQNGSDYTKGFVVGLNVAF